MFLCAGIFDVPFLYAQTVLSGRVIDAQTGESLPAANVQIEDTFRGTITNAEGVFTLRVDALPATLVVRYIGYETERLEVTDVPEGDVEMRLQPVVYELEEVVVTDQDAAVSIMRKVIERKQQWREALLAYEAEAYTRFTLENDTGIVSILESITDVYWLKDEGMREVVKAQRRTSNMEFDEFMPAAQFIANMYDDNIDIAGYTFVGVTHPGALKTYDFELVGYRYIDDRLIYDISVQPKNKFKTAFHGLISVLDEEYALLEVTLQPGDSFRFPPPVSGFDISFVQQFSDFGGSFWLPVDFRSEMVLDIGIGRLLSLPSIYVSQVSRMADYMVNEPVPDSLFVEERETVADSVALADTTMFASSGLAVPLNRAEVAAYETIDSTLVMEKAYEPRGALARFVDVEDEDGGGSSEDRNGLDLGLDVSPHLRFNRVEGLYGELDVRRSFGRAYTLYTKAGYSTALPASDAFSFGVGNRISVGRTNRFSLDVSYDQYTPTQTSSTPLLRTLSGLTTVMGGDDYYDYYRAERFKTELQWRSRALDSRMSIGLHVEDHEFLEKQTDYDLWGTRSLRRPNAAVNAGELRSFTIGIHVGDDGNGGGFTGKRSLALMLEHSDDQFLDTDFEFTRAQAILDWRFDTFFKRRLIPNTLDLQIHAATSSGDLPLQRQWAVDGSVEIFSRFGVLRTKEVAPYRGEHALAFFWEHNFKTVPFELLGMERLADNALNLIIYGGHGRTWIDDTGNAPLSESLFLNESGGWHSELGISLSGLFTLFRIDFTTRLDEPGYHIGIGTARIF